MSRVPTGRLLDYAIDKVEYSLYNGTLQDDSCAVNYSTFELILQSILSSNVSPESPFGPIDTYTAQLDSTIYDDTIIPVGVCAYKYNYIVANALTDSLITYNESLDKVADAFSSDGAWKNPYGESYVMAFSPRLNVSCSRTITYLFSHDNILTDLSVAYLEFDAGDGNGFQTISEDSEVTVSYPFFSYYYPVLKIHLHDGSILIGKTVMYLVDPMTGSPAQNMATQIYYPDDYFSVVGSDNVNGFSAEAKVSVKYAIGGGNQTALRRPFIVAEGIDPFSYNYYYDNSGYYKSLGLNNLNIFLLTAPEIWNNYDIVYIDWLNSNASIQTSADIIRQVIEWVNDNKEDSSVPNVLMGESMGGIAARYALCKMEEVGYEHQVGTYISHDSPHLGANVSLGIYYGAQVFFPIMKQYWADAYPILERLSSDYRFIQMDHFVDELEALINAYSTRQLSYYYVNGSLNVNRQIYQQWQNELNNLGFPQGDGIKQFVSIASSNGGNHASYDRNEPFINVSGNLSVKALGNILVNAAFNGFWSTVGSVLFPHAKYYTFNTAMSPFYGSANPVFTCQLNYYKKFLWFRGKTISVINTQKYPPSMGYPLDKAFASNYTIDINGGTINEALPTLGSINLLVSFGRSNTVGFIPLVSSLCIGKGERPVTDSEYREDFSDSTNYFFNRTPFNSYYVNSMSTKHTKYLPGMSTWIQEMDTLRIAGPSTVVSGDCFSMTNPSLHPTWTSSNNSIATVSPTSGQVTVNAQGDFNLSCTGKGANYRPYHFEKAIKTAVFDYTLSSSCPPGSMSNKPFAVRANSTTWDQTSGNPPHQFITNTSGHRFFFSVHPLGSSAPITWHEEITPDAFLSVPEGETSIVSFKAEYNGIYSDVQTVVCHNPLEIPGFPIDDGGEIGPGHGGGDLIDPEDPGEVGPEGASPSSSECLFIVEGQELLYPEMPTTQILLEDIKRIPSFCKKIEQVKPRGSKDFLLLPCQYIEKDSGNKYDLVLKFIYKGK